MRALLQDVRYGIRLMRRTPGFTIAAAGTLAIGIGANTAVFSVVNVMALKPLAYRDADDVAFVLGWDAEQQSMRFNLTLADFDDLRGRADTLQDVAAYSYWSANFTDGHAPERVQAYRVTANTFDLLGVAPVAGRSFSPAEGRPGAPNVAVISHGLWQRRFGGDRGVLGRTVHIDGRPHAIIGVMPSRFEFPVVNFKGELWAPLPLAGGVRGAEVAAASVVVVARVREHATYEGAQAELDTIMRRLAADYPETNRGVGARLVPMGELDDELTGPAAWIALATVAVVLLLACANVANLLLARGIARQRELAVRAALGAGRWRVVRQLAVESLLLAVAGAVLGSGLAVAALRVLRRSLPEIVETTMPNLDALGLDTLTLAYTAALCGCATLLFGALPAYRGARADVLDSMRGATGTGGSRRTTRVRAALVVFEVTLATVLLVTAGLLVRSYRHQRALTPGFDPSHVLTMTISLPAYRYGDPEAQRGFFEAAADRIAQVPGVQSAAFVNVLPFSTYDRGGRFVVEGQEPPEPGREPFARVRIVTPDYFRTMRMRVLRGRGFDRGDRADTGRVAIVNETLARRMFERRDPVGRRLRLGSVAEGGTIATIVGIASDVRHDALTAAPHSDIYLPQAQEPVSMMMLAARTERDPAAFVDAARAAIAAIDPAQPVYHVTTLERLVADSLLTETSSAALMTLFSAIALMLAAMGVYGVIAYAVSQQTRDFGVRLALGAKPVDLLALVVRGGVTLVATGILLGAALAAATSRLIASALHGVAPLDPASYAAALILIGAAGAAASVVPALRASRIQPMEALRVD
jgi:putative ABC transport system permease protein